MKLYCPKHQAYQAKLKPRVKRICWCWPLYWLRRIFPAITVGIPRPPSLPKQISLGL